MSPSAKQTMNTSGLTIFNANEHKVGVVTGLDIANNSAYDEVVTLADCFDSDASKTMAAGATTAAESFTGGLSGKVRFKAIVPAGDTLIVGKDELENAKFLGACKVIGSTQTSDCICVVRYEMR